VDKLIAEYSCGHVSAAILLTNGYTDKQWFHDIAANAAAICFTRNRIKFVRPNGEESHPPYGQALAYFGKNVARFKRHFADVGFIVVPHK
jgi:hypothetical protein